VVAVGSRAIRGFVIAGLIGLMVAGAAPAAQAHRTELEVQIDSDQSSITPDGRSMRFHITTRCDRKWAIVEATVSVTQSGASGSGPFTPSCNRLTNGVTVTVPVVSGTFHTGPAEATAVLVVGQGPKKRAEDSGSLRVRPSVSALLADQATLEPDGAVLIDVTVTCPMSAVGRGGNVRIYDGRIVGTGTFGPTPCDALPHTVSVRVASSEGSFQVGSAEASAAASIEEGGDLFSSFDLRTIQIVEA
jgi:hypothetical protein